MANQVGQSTKSKWLPKDYVSLLTTACHEPMLWWIYKGIHTFLVKVKGLVLFVLEIIKGVVMDETV